MKVQPQPLHRNTGHCLRVGLVGILMILLAQTVGAQKNYVSKYRPLADSLSAVYEIPAGVILAVAIVESGGGNSRNARLLNNHFGIVGKNNLLATKGIRTRYKQYPSVAASYTAFCQLLTRKKFYKKLKGEKKAKDWIEAISKAGYSESPKEWVKRVSETVKKYKLDKK